MPNPTLPDTPVGAAQGWADGVEGADMSFEDLFGNPSEGLVVTDPNAQTTAPPNGEPPTPVEPQAPVQPKFEFQTKTGTVYKSMEEAIKGTEEKDTLIETLRQEFITRTGIDPVTRRPVVQHEQPRSYMDNPAQFTKDLRKAVEANDDAAYAQANIKLLADMLAPIEPLVTKYAQQSAVEQVSGQIKDFQTFRGSQDFNKVMDTNATLKNAIQVAESDIRLANQLPELYQLAYYAAQGMKTPDLIQAARAAQPAAPQPPARTPMQGSTLAPDLSPAAPPTVATTEGRKAIIEQFERGGGLNLKF
jgi:hypothetical protein